MLLQNLTIVHCRWMQEVFPKCGYDSSTLKMETSRYSKAPVLSVFYPEDEGNITLQVRYVWLINPEVGGRRFLRKLGTCL